MAQSLSIRPSNASFEPSMRLPPPPRANASGADPYELLHFSIQFNIIKSAYIPFVALGIVGNVASLWIWHAQRAFSPSTFLFKYLAVADIGFLVGETVTLSQSFKYRDHSLRTLPGHFGKLFQDMSVATTLAVAAFRVIAVWRPMHAPVLLSRGRVLAVGAAIFVWGVAVETVRLVAMTCLSLYPPRPGVRPPDHCKPFLQAFKPLYAFRRNEIETFFIPLVLMLILNVIIVWKIRHRDVITTVTQEQRTAAKKSSLRITICAVVITFTCVICYPMTFIVRWAVLGNASAQIVGICAAVSVLMTYFNSSVNVIYYWIFTSEFRRLARARLRFLCPEPTRKRNGSTAISVSNSSQLSTMPAYTENSELEVEAKI